MTKLTEDPEKVKRTMNALQRFIERIRDIFDPTNRAIVSMDEWSGAASNYSDTDAYCSACLIDVNSAAGRDEKAQSHCMLPIRLEEHDSDMFVDKAVHAAAGGHGITAVSRPSDVPQEDWDAAVKAAANKLISAYNQMDETAPDAVYELAGKNPPENREKTRAVALAQIWDRVWSELDKMDGMSEGWPWPVDVYVEDRQGTDEFFVLVAKDGKLFRWPVDVMEGDSINFGMMSEVTTTFTSVEGRTISISRQDNGRVRVAQIVNTAVLNRVGEIDSTLMFDKFIEHARETSAWPLIDVNHWNEIVVGHVIPGGLFRDEWCYGAIWEFNDTELGRAAEKGFMEDPDYWGSSIQFMPLEREFIEADGMRIPVFVDGVNTYITLTPETRAAAWFTGEKITRSKPMTDQDFAELVKLIGEEAAASFRDKIREINRDIVANGQIARQQAGENVEPPVVADPETDESDTSQVVTEIVELDMEDEGIIRAVAEAAVSAPAFGESVSSILREMINPLLAERDSQIASLNESVEKLVDALDERIGQLERDDDKKKADWLSEIPVRQVFVKGNTHRPREAREEEEEGTLESFATKATETLAAWKD